MNRFAPAGALALALSVPLPAFATAQRTFVSVGGSDAQPCSVAQPCRSFAAAIAQTNPGGEVIALDSGGYGAVTVDKSVSIVSPAGVYAGISVFNGAGVTIAAGANDTVKLRGLVINAQGAGTRGIHFTAGGKLEIEGCTISGAFAHGIRVYGPMTPRIVVKDTHIQEAAVAMDIGGPGGEMVRLTMTDSVISHVGFGINVAAGSEIVVTNSQLIGPYSSGGTGIALSATTSHAPVQAHIAHSLIREFAIAVSAVQSVPSAKLSIASTDFVHNSIAVSTSGATIALDGNRMAQNGQAVYITGGTVDTAGTNYSAYNTIFGNAVTGPLGTF